VQLLSQQYVWLGAMATTRGVIELYDDQLQVALVDAATNARLKTVLNERFAALKFERYQTTLKLIGANSRATIGFAEGSIAAFALGGVLGSAIHKAATAEAGIDEWERALRERGVRKGMGSGRRVALIAAVLIVLVVALLSLNGLR